MKPVLMARDLLADGPLVCDAEKIVRITYCADGISMTGLFRLVCTADGLFVACTACGKLSRCLYRHPAGRGLICVDCLSVARGAFEASTFDWPNERRK